MTDDHIELDKLADNLNDKQKQFIRDNVSEQELFDLWIIQFDEHTHMCDVCTLTWADDYCEDYKKLLELIKLS